MVHRDEVKATPRRFPSVKAASASKARLDVYVCYDTAILRSEIHESG